DRLESELKAVSATVIRAASLGQAWDYIALLARERSASLVVRTTHSILGESPLDQRLVDLGTQVFVTSASDVAVSEERLALVKERCAQAQIGITGVDYAVAETGTLVLLTGPGTGRLPSLLPPLHIALVEKRQVVGTLEELLAILAERHLRPGEPFNSCVTFITGPSRSSDIEMTITLGVHGPKELHVIIIE
ncbi:MAG: lactate utilization protein, partial [Chloroflexi bacterium]|nr:lactate utilization protein [Chloroflexota bacterium]